MSTKHRLARYGELGRGSLRGHTKVVRGIYQQRGDTLHVRVLRGKGLPSDETEPGNVLFKKSIKYQGGDPLEEIGVLHDEIMRALDRESLASAQRWQRRPGRKILGGRTVKS